MIRKKRLLKTNIAKQHIAKSIATKMIELGIGQMAKAHLRAEMLGLTSNSGKARVVVPERQCQPRADAPARWESGLTNMWGDFWRLSELSKAIDGAGEDLGLPMEVRKWQMVDGDEPLVGKFLSGAIGRAWPGYTLRMDIEAIYRAD
ncbi:hypothetical protein PPACK8108_LOCUS6882 [Phakopsora pachyrhizi]|uniref:Uncharacterized protein n=1 Tax=Phakopsora pachyrhizi TaxID=170000 RepID=A0AAV0AV68_PHAPC|nr:hypothetical protein PPACK8108_LOCUS6882 [Phakopsora pachyrhizi]